MTTKAPRRVGVLVVVLAVALALVLASGGVAAHEGDDGFHHHDGPFGMHDGAWWGFGWLWMLVGLLALVSLPVVTLLLVRRETTGDGGGRTDTAMERLRERYAAGEIDEEEYQQRRATLRD